MTAPRLAGQGIFAALVVAIGAVSALELTSSMGGLVRWSGCSVLIPLVAAALLTLGQTLVVAALTLAASLAVYGFGLSEVSTGGRAVVLSLIAVSCTASVVVCRVRLDRERRLKDVMIARDRLVLLSDATRSVGSSLDIVRTARELAEIAVPGFADFVGVDLLEPVLQGREPPPGPLEGTVALRRVAVQSVYAGCPENTLAAAPGEWYPRLSLPARSLGTSGPVEAVFLDDLEVDRRLGRDSRHATAACECQTHSALAVPLCARGVVLGAVMFLRHRHRDPFDADDRLLAEEIASRAAVCVDNARRFTRERETAVVLQRSLLPQHLPLLSAVDVASRYLPAGSGIGVGGDWFDVIPLSSARVALVVGDVVGHGLHASATMARLRTAVRTLADIDLPPDELLTHLDDVVIRLGAEITDDDGPDPGDEGSAGDIGATCLYAVYDPVARRCALARAGHLPAAVVRPDGTAEFLDIPAGPPLGLGSQPFEATEVDLPDGSLLALYTDGLVASRSQDIETQLHTLLGLLARPAPDLEATCDAILDNLLQDRQPADDVALLVARTRALGRNHVATWDLSPDPAAVADARHRVSVQLDMWGLEDVAFTTELMVSELVTNAIRHARTPGKLRIILERESLICEVSDGSLTSPHLRRARTFDEGGRGLLIVAQLAQRWGTRYDHDGKTIWAEQTMATHPGRLPAAV
jgi:serine phosphatase RsbU (regulator of sigma subunit)/anti-sigma regulatory factor (Ser/Thr protein kinase)